MKSRGFTLIEIAIVLLIIAALGGLAAQAMTSVMMNARYAAIRTNFEAIKGAIIWNVVQTRVCALPAVPPCNPATYTYTFPASGTALAAMGFAVQTANDPWGQPYRYTSTVMPQPAVLAPPPPPGLAPGAEVFTLTSLGPDGILGNADDVSQSVYVIEVQGMLAKF